MLHMFAISDYTVCFVFIDCKLMVYLTASSVVKLLIVWSTIPINSSHNN